MRLQGSDGPVSYEAKPHFSEEADSSFWEASKSMGGHFHPTVTLFPQIMSGGFCKHLKLPLSRNAFEVGMTSSSMFSGSKPRESRVTYAMKSVFKDASEPTLIVWGIITLPDI